MNATISIGTISRPVSLPGEWNAETAVSWERCDDKALPMRPVSPGLLMRLRKVLSFMESNLGAKMNIAQLAVIGNVSPSHFHHLFKTCLGVTPMKYFNQLRAHQAAVWLLSTSMQIKEIAHWLGYKDQFHFTRAFKSVYGLPPSRYRLAQPASSFPAQTNPMGSVPPIPG